MSDEPKLSGSSVPLCIEPPEIAAAPDQRDWGQPVDGIAVYSEKGMWEARAKAATEAAEHLEKCRAAAVKIAQVNYLGDDCEEGDALREKIRNLVVSDVGWQGNLVSQVSSLRALAQQCSAAAEVIEQTDIEGSLDFDHGPN
ncbi:hypothetical protein V1Y59_06470 [Gordonia sp. PKS22-38]|uniref:Uncharacterized protein n=1 Tax=Gordonia prachuapensis TaxID=3115651 RepID=A0ABU7MQW2_9ACTN|nr:hypothetical protein [Gordonia sp. PKS22-38]